MTTISAKIIAKAISLDGIPIKCMAVRYPHVVHPEHLRHRAFSFSVSSSRAIPTNRLIADVESDPYIPLEWNRASKGMAANEPLEGQALDIVRDTYMRSLEQAISSAKKIATHSASKEMVNRLLEPYSHVNCIVTGTNWQNFYALRRPDINDPSKKIEPHMRMLADECFTADQQCDPAVLNYTDWFLPLVQPDDWNQLPGLTESERIECLRMVSAGRCAGGSYTLRDVRVRPLDVDYQLGCWLASNEPLHASPFEHQAQPDPVVGVVSYTDSKGNLKYRSKWANEHLHGNFAGWKQSRKMLENENVLDSELVYHYNR